MNGMKRILAGIGFCLLAIACVYGTTLDSQISEFYELFTIVLFPLIGLILIISGLVTKD